jgi:hypothetical protein
MEKGESTLIRIVLKSDEKTYLVEKINKKTIKLDRKKELIKPEEILAITYCPIERLAEIALLFKEEVIENE